ncbi:LysE family translocator [Actinomadura meridiana]|uniref:LysE family translocator n=1 Tax=Actinomadura meridiana TaxID=559626 RepID=UPI0031EE9B4C
MITLAFLTSSALVIMAPGPDLAFITRTVLRRGRRPAMAAAAGMINAGALQAAIGFVGVAVLIPPNLLRLLGAATLTLFGAFFVRAAVRPTAAPDGDVQGAPDRARRAYFQGLACTGLNPKVGVFLIAYLPQFVPPGARTGPSTAVLMAVYLGMGMAWLAIWIGVVHRLGKLFLAPRMVRASDLFVGLVLMTFGLRLAIL